MTKMHAFIGLLPKILHQLDYIINHSGICWYILTYIPASFELTRQNFHIYWFMLPNILGIMETNLPSFAATFNEDPFGFPMSRPMHDIFME